MSQEHPDTPKRNDLTEAVRSSALPQRDGTQVSQEAHASWEIARLVDERTGDSCLGFDFPTRLQGRAFEVVDDDLTEKPDRIRALLKKRGAAFEGSTEDQIKFVKKLIKTLSPEPQ